MSRPQDIFFLWDVKAAVATPAGIASAMVSGTMSVGSAIVDEASLGAKCVPAPQFKREVC